MRMLKFSLYVACVHLPAADRRQRRQCMRRSLITTRTEEMTIPCHLRTHFSANKDIIALSVSQKITIMLPRPGKLIPVLGMKE